MQSLFGLTPTAVQQTMRAEEEARARTQAGLLQGNPFAAGAYGALQTGERLLSGTRELAGIVDPRMQAAQRLQGIVQSVQQSGADLATPEGLVQLANELNKVPDFAGFAVGMRQQAAKMSQEGKKAALGEELIMSQIEENKAQAEKARREPTPKPEKIDRQDRWVALDAKKQSEGLTKAEEAEYKSLSRLLFKPEKGTEDTTTATRWNLETQSAQTTLEAMGVDWTKPLTGRNAALPGIVEVYQKANRGAWPGTTLRPAPAPQPTGGKRTAKPLPPNPSPANLEKGQVYITARGNATWDGSKFIPTTGQ
jgi:hypothetical protein